MVHSNYFKISSNLILDYVTIRASKIIANAKFNEQFGSQTCETEMKIL